MEMNHLMEKKESSRLIDGTESSSEHIPSLFSRYMRLVPFVETLGYLKDHRMMYKQNWITACQMDNDGDRLKSGLTYMFEMELLFAALILGVTTDMYFDDMNSDSSATMIENFTNLSVDTLEFWCVVVGTMTINVQLYFCIAAYIMIQMMQPVSKANFIVWSKSISTQRALAIPNFLLLVGTYSMALYFIMLCVKVVNGAPLIIWIVGTIFAITLSYFILFFNISFNTAQKSGAYSSVPLVTDEEKLKKLSSNECEKLIYEACKRNEELNDNWDDVERFYLSLKERYDAQHSDKKKHAQIDMEEEDTNMEKRSSMQRRGSARSSLKATTAMRHN
jgi:hypothetical protein